MGRTWIHTDAERDALDDAAAAAAANATMESAGDTRPLRDGPATAGGDKRRARGVPIIAQGVPGTAIGTDPLGEMLRRESRMMRKNEEAPARRQPPGARHHGGTP